METIRIFIAIDIPQEIKMELDKLISGLRPYGPDIKWVKAANLHLTLRFLGEIPANSIGGLASEIGKNIGAFGQFKATLCGLGGFPNLKRPRVIWVGTGNGTDKLQALAPHVEKACIDRGLGEADKPFSSHLTIGRVNFPGGFEKLTSQIESTKFESAVINIDEIVIFRSQLSPAGPKYTALERIKL